ncbi:hypothetical protein TgHK011_003066 [Trichoderma gracile]|nr:hypothetical protein TgHK011_003066 [Trichoderma gracile]
MMASAVPTQRLRGHPRIYRIRCIHCRYDKREPVVIHSTASWDEVVADALPQTQATLLAKQRTDASDRSHSLALNSDGDSARRPVGLVSGALRALKLADCVAPGFKVDTASGTSRIAGSGAGHSMRSCKSGGRWLRLDAAVASLFAQRPPLSLSLPHTPRATIHTPQPDARIVVNRAPWTPPAFVLRFRLCMVHWRHETTSKDDQMLRPEVMIHAVSTSRLVAAPPR